MIKFTIFCQNLSHALSNLWHQWWHPKSIIFVQSRFHHFVLESRLFYKTYFFEVLYGLVHDIVAHINGATSLACLLVHWLLLERRWCCFGRRSSGASQWSIVSVCGLRNGIVRHQNGMLLSLTRCLLHLIMLLTRGTSCSTVCRWRRLTQVRRRWWGRKLSLKRLKSNCLMLQARASKQGFRLYIHLHHWKELRRSVSHLPWRWTEVSWNLHHRRWNTKMWRQTFNVQSNRRWWIRRLDQLRDKR